MRLTILFKIKTLKTSATQLNSIVLKRDVSKPGNTYPEKSLKMKEMKKYWMSSLRKNQDHNIVTRKAELKFQTRSLKEDKANHVIKNKMKNEKY